MQKWSWSHDFKIRKQSRAQCKPIIMSVFVFQQLRFTWRPQPKCHTRKLKLLVFPAGTKTFKLLHVGCIESSCRTTSTDMRKAHTLILSSDRMATRWLGHNPNLAFRPAAITPLLPPGDPPLGPGDPDQLWSTDGFGYLTSEVNTNTTLPALLGGCKCRLAHGRGGCRGLEEATGYMSHNV